MFDINDIEIYGGDRRTIEGLRTLTTTPIGTCPMSRQFGVDMNILDVPETHIKPRVAVEFRTKINQYMPLVDVREISFSKNDYGHIVPRVVIA